MLAHAPLLMSGRDSEICCEHGPCFSCRSTLTLPLLFEALKANVTNSELFVSQQWTRRAIRYGRARVRHLLGLRWFFPFRILTFSLAVLWLSDLLAFSFPQIVLDCDKRERR